MLDKAVDESKKLKRRGTPNVIVFAGMILPQPFTFPLLMSQRHVRFLHHVAQALPGPLAKKEEGASASAGPGMHADSPKVESRYAAGANTNSTTPASMSPTSCTARAIQVQHTTPPFFETVRSSHQARNGDECAAGSAVKHEGTAHKQTVLVDRMVAQVSGAGAASAAMQGLIPRDHSAFKAPEGYMSLFKTLQEYLLRVEYVLWGLLDGGWAGATSMPRAAPIQMCNVNKADLRLIAALSC